MKVTAIASLFCKYLLIIEEFSLFRLTPLSLSLSPPLLLLTLSIGCFDSEQVTYQVLKQLPLLTQANSLQLQFIVCLSGIQEVPPQTPSPSSLSSPSSDLLHCGLCSVAQSRAFLSNTLAKYQVPVPFATPTP